MPTYDAFIVDAFTSERFAGNQAAVCLIEQCLEDNEYQRIASEFNYSETAFPIPLDTNDYHTASRFSLRWFTPKCEVNLCGHATLATSHVIFNEIGNKSPKIDFETRCGVLSVERSSPQDSCLRMNFPQHRIVTLPFGSSRHNFTDKFEKACAPPFLDELVACLIPQFVQIEGIAYAPEAKNLLIILDNKTTREEMLSIKTASDALLAVDPSGSFVNGIIVTFRQTNEKSFVDANGKPYDFISRYFAPWLGVAEDPATGFAHCTLGPFWQKFFPDKRILYAYQCYPTRGAQFRVELSVDSRILIMGCSVTFVRGKVEI